MDWPSQSPDLNVTEAIWDHLWREINKIQPKLQEELWEVLKDSWSSQVFAKQCDLPWH